MYIHRRRSINAIRIQTNFWLHLIRSKYSPRHLHNYRFLPACSVTSWMVRRNNWPPRTVYCRNIRSPLVIFGEQSSCDELMEFKQIQTRAQPEESLKHNHSCTNISPRTRPLLLHSGDRFVQLWLCFNDSSGCALV